ncbi:MAG TPA: PAS domain-containing protein, partial [Methanomicrobiales archaeon]|nr:PAS domain-containing protein [Methanomicrobiales archaeon]
VFVLAHRLPVSALFDLASDPVCIIDQRRVLTFANTSFFSFFGSSEKDALHRGLDEIGFDVSVIPQPGEFTRDASARKEGIREGEFRKGGTGYQFRIRMLPVTFEDGMKGTAFLFDDITREKKHLENLEFLARTSAELADMGDDENIYQYIADRVAELEPRAHVNVNSVDPERMITIVRATSSADLQFLREFNDSFADLGDFSEMTFDMNRIPEGIQVLMKGSIMEGPRSLYEISWHLLPEAACSEIQEKFRLDRNFVMGCSCKGGLYGHVALRFRKGDEMENKPTVEAFVRQAGVALQRRYLREKLRRIEGREETRRQTR